MYLSRSASQRRYIVSILFNLPICLYMIFRNINHFIIIWVIIKVLKFEVLKYADYKILTGSHQESNQL